MWACQSDKNTPPSSGVLNLQMAFIIMEWCGSAHVDSDMWVGQV